MFQEFDWPLALRMLVFLEIYFKQQFICMFEEIGNGFHGLLS